MEPDPPDWCVNCAAEASDECFIGVEHKVICRPPRGWESCDCHWCRVAVAQYERKNE